VSLQIFGTFFAAFSKDMSGHAAKEGLAKGEKFWSQKVAIFVHLNST
jgi:hypothetical protein